MSARVAGRRGIRALAVPMLIACSAALVELQRPRRRRRCAAPIPFVTPAPPGPTRLGGDDQRGGDGGAPAGSTRAPAAAAPTSADLDFIAAMIQHHEQAVEFAGLAEQRAGDDELAALAARIVVVQSAEADAMRAWLDRRASSGSTDGHPHETAMPGEISRTTIDRAAGAEGASFDARFITAMVAHHRGAIAMAQSRLAAEGDAAVARWARAIATAQAIEIDRLLEIERRIDAG